jgi:myo-inositol-1(or 4)-monophosphatase
VEPELIDIAREAAQAAAAELLPRFGQRARGVRSKSGPTDLVSEADVRAEAAIRALLGERRPDDAVVGEEGGGDERKLDDADGSRLRWVVDPLDGTINFLFGVPLFAVSVACEDDDGTLAGVVLDPVRDESVEATRSGRATLNGEVIAGSERDDLATALVATGFGYDAQRRARQAEVVARVLPRVRDIRRCGAAAMDLCWSACGRFDAYYERGLQAWDLAAGGLIAERAGLVVRELAATAEDPSGVVAAPRAMVDELYALVVGE